MYDNYNEADIYNSGEWLFTAVTGYFEQVCQALQNLDQHQIAQLIGVLLKANERGSNIFIFGNGGSAATASHFANDLAKGCTVQEQPRFRAIALTDNIPLITAWANDSSYEQVFAEQLCNLVRPNDIVIGISGSGNSPNVLRGIEVGHEAGAITVGLCGFGGGKLQKIVDLAIISNCLIMEQVEDVHLSLCHNIATQLRKTLKLNMKNQ
jgi:D-sedoheptulose 7-phosphate isomerase